MASYYTITAIYSTVYRVKLLLRPIHSLRQLTIA